MTSSARNWTIIGIVALALIGVFAWQKNRSASEPTATESTSAATTVSTVDYQCEAGKTAYTVLDEQFEVNAQDTPYGKQVMGIAGNTPSGNQFWAFYINGQSATVGADSYQCTGTEQIEWKVEPF